MMCRETRIVILPAERNNLECVLLDGKFLQQQQHACQIVQDMTLSGICYFFLLAEAGVAFCGCLYCVYGKSKKMFQFLENSLYIRVNMELSCLSVLVLWSQNCGL